ncbi:MAG: tRNA (guanosine(37)-N1)-methyltransferase TrmD [Acidimicrobiia bacterium]|nr:tRNA (guanosine(37)-N1)-methyltransferase TrmD [Actinomycetota bacterium]MBL6923876.1 tRNA (guanosine(37)-N1)-methyltransferase TrmD [Acidimicrobiia bacterium]MBL6926367.1 tRNA (guanosine(37)-N1)-methyltransferase TrmD [Acidimicrobiia bacterium]
MRVEVFTLFPEMIDDYVGLSLLGRAIASGSLEVVSHDLRLATSDVHRTVDDSPFGGGAGMVLMPEPVFAAVEAVAPPRPLILLGPGGRTFDQGVASELSALEGFSLVCGRYEGVDERIRTDLCDDEISIGDYVLAGGELAALAVIETVARLQDGVLGNEESVLEESHAAGLLEYPHYTRPADFRGLEVPEVLRSGDHDRVRRWRLAASLARTIVNRPDMIDQRGGLSDGERQLLEEFGFAI